MKTLISLTRIVAIVGLFTLTTLPPCAAAAETAQPSLRAYGENADVGSTFVFQGNRFYYEIYGSGAPVLLIHGNGGSINDFQEQIAVFAKHHKVIIMDSRGQGKSELGTDRLTYEHMADDTNALLEHLKLDHVPVLGQSDGGIIGLLLAIHHPEKVSKLAVMGANIEPDGAYQWAVDGVARTRKRVMAELAHSIDAQTPQSPLLSQHLSQQLSQQQSQLKLQLQLIDLLGNQPHIPLADLTRIEVPTLVMAGDRDVIRDDHTLRIFHAIKNSQLAIFPGATHVIAAQDPARFNQTVLDFFDKPFEMPDTKDMGWFDSASS